MILFSLLILLYDIALIFKSACPPWESKTEKNANQKAYIAWRALKFKTCAKAAATLDKYD